MPVPGMRWSPSSTPSWLSDEQLGEVHAANSRFRRLVGAFRFNLLTIVLRLISTPRLLYRLIAGGRRQAAVPLLQIPWMPRFSGLQAQPVHDLADHPWTELLRQASGDIRDELIAVQPSFRLARYASDLNPKPWTTFYFFLEGRPFLENLAACPRTAAVLSKIPHNGFHVCFSAIEPNGSLQPHTGPTNASLTAHLGLIDCAGARLWVADSFADYRDGEVFVFDDSFVHSVEHAGVRTRYTLMITFWHPEISRIERAFMEQIVRMAPK